MQKPTSPIAQWEYVDLLFLQRMRTENDRLQVKELFRKIFGNHFPISDSLPFYHVTPDYLQVRKCNSPSV